MKKSVKWKKYHEEIFFRNGMLLAIKNPKSWRNKKKINDNKTQKLKTQNSNCDKPKNLNCDKTKKKIK